MRWFFPSFSGDFRLVPDGEGSKLVAERITPGERAILAKFFEQARKKKWVPNDLPNHFTSDSPPPETQQLRLDAPVEKAGRALLKLCRPKKATLTAIKYQDGKVAVAEGAEPEALDEILSHKAQAAASVARPTPSCPMCEAGDANRRASEVLLSFLTPAQHESWAKERSILVHGGLSGHRYILAHRNSSRAARQGRICVDVDSRAVLHFHDTSVPPEEEVLAAKLILEHREPWLRNEATLWHIYREARVEPMFKNPFGNFRDGAPDAAFVTGLGTFGQALLG